MASIRKQLNQRLSKLSEEQEKVLNSLRLSRMIIPILLGLGVVGGYMYYQLTKSDQLEQIQRINWSWQTLMWILLAFLLVIARHLAFSYRMWILSQGHFSFRKCIELIFIFEFSLCVTPTTAGGSAVSLFVLTQEKLSAARTTTIVLYKVVLDTLFFISTFPLLLLICGPMMIRPDMQSLMDLDWRARIFYLSYIGMAAYGSFLYYGLFVNPELIKKVLVFATRPRFLQRFKGSMEKLGNEIVLASAEMRQMHRSEHIKAFLATWLAWACKFFLISCLIIGIVHPHLDWFRQTLLYSRLQSMFIIMAFSPTPGGAGFAEGVFPQFLSDFIASPAVAVIVAFIWRLITYYIYLAAGAIIVPNWIRKVFIANLNQK